MPLVTMKSLLWAAQRQNYAVGGFNVSNLEMILGAVHAAEELASPLILQIAEIRLPHSPLPVIGPAMVAAAQGAKVPVAVNLDHGRTVERIREALGLGFTSVMIDGSMQPMAENIRITNEVCRLAETYGATVEAEIGAIHPSGAAVEYTDAGEAVKFCNAVGADALAVAIGNAHGLYTGEPHLHFDILADIHGRLPVPLVLHGGTGIGEADIRKCVRNGIRKVNVATATFRTVEEHVRLLYADGQPESYFTLQDTEAAGAYENVKKHILMFGSTGKAAQKSISPLSEDKKWDT